MSAAMEKSVFGDGIDMEEYFAKRALEIRDLDERRLFKAVGETLLLELYRHTQREYLALEKRVFDELEPQDGDCAIHIGVTDREHYDATDPFLHPMLDEDTQPPTHDAAELLQAVSGKRSYPLFTVFLEADCVTAREFSRPGRVYSGTVRTPRGEHRAACTVRLHDGYLSKIEELYGIFNLNFLPWSTVCTAYLHKFFIAELISVEGMEPEDTVTEVRIDFEEYQPQIRYSCFPVWNLCRTEEKTSAYPDGCVDKVNYDHHIFAHRLTSGCRYLVTNTDVEVTNIRSVAGDLIITCAESLPRRWSLYRVDTPSKSSHGVYPVLSNRSRERFAGNLSERYRRGVKTKAELARVLGAFGYDDYVTFQDAKLAPINAEEPVTYSMDDFLSDDLRAERNGKTALTLLFSSPRPEHFLTLDIMSFLTTQAQGLFPEYLCVGQLV